MKFWTTGTKHQPLDIMNPSWWWHVLFGMALHILRCCKHCVKQFKGTFGIIAESMSVKLPATLNIQPEYVFYTKFVGSIILSPSNYFSLETLSAAIKTVVSAYYFAPGMGIWLKMETQGWGNWHLKTENVKFPVGCAPPPPPPPILGQTINRCIRSNFTTVQTKHCVTLA